MVDASLYLDIAYRAAQKFTRERPIEDTEEYAEACLALTRAARKFQLDPKKGKDFSGYAYQSCVHLLIQFQDKRIRRETTVLIPARSGSIIFQKLKHRVGSFDDHVSKLSLDRICCQEVKQINWDEVEKAEKRLAEKLHPDEVVLVKERWQDVPIQNMANARGISNRNLRQRLYRAYYKLGLYSR